MDKNIIKAKDKDFNEEYHKTNKEIRNQTLNQCRQSKKNLFSKILFIKC